jgi:hypothetical protein
LSGSFESLPLGAASDEFPSPKTGVRSPSNGDAAIPFALCEPTSLAWLFVS